MKKAFVLGFWIALGFCALCPRVGAAAADSIDWRTYLEGLRGEGRLDAVVDAFEAHLIERGIPESIHGPLLAVLRRAVQEKQLDTLDRFPLLPTPEKLAPWIHAAPALLGSGAMGVGPVAAAIPKRVVELGEYLVRPCSRERVQPAPVSSRIPDLLYGHFPDPQLDDCTYQDSGLMAELMTSLAVNNGSSVTYQGKKYRLGAQFIEALLGSGHEITVQEERMFADFLSWAVSDPVSGAQTYIRMPVWIDTGLVLAGEKLALPVLHSHHAWSIKGPDVNARFAFYLGNQGVGFFPLRTRRPGWNGGGQSALSVTATGLDANRNAVMRSVVGAEKILQSIMSEAERAQLPVSGYGVLGVCNDSNAVMLKWMSKLLPAIPFVHYPYPLLRKPGLPPILDTLPVSSDVGVAPQDDLTTLCRLLASYPVRLGENCWDKLLDSQMQQVADRIRLLGGDPAACHLGLH